MATKPATKKTTNHRAARAAKKGPHKSSVASDKSKLKASLKKGTKVETAEDDEEELEWGEVKKPGTKKNGKKYPKLDLIPIKVQAKVVGKGKKARKVKPKKLSASQVLNHLVAVTELPRKEVKQVLEALSETVKAAIMPGAVGGMVIPGVGAFVRKEIAPKKVDAVKRGTVVEKRNPRTGEVTKFKHPGQKAYVKPGRVKVRTIPLSAVRRAAQGTE